MDGGKEIWSSTGLQQVGKNSSRSKAQHSPRLGTLGPRDSWEVTGEFRNVLIPKPGWGKKAGDRRTQDVADFGCGALAKPILPACSPWLLCSPSFSDPAGGSCFPSPWLLFSSFSQGFLEEEQHHNTLVCPGPSSSSLLWAEEGPHTVPKGYQPVHGYSGAKSPYQFSARTKVQNSYMAGTQHSLSKPWLFDMSALAKEKHRISIPFCQSSLTRGTFKLEPYRLFQLFPWKKKSKQLTCFPWGKNIQKNYEHS